MLGDRGALLSYHSLSIRDHHDSEDPNTAEFFLDTRYVANDFDPERYSRRDATDNFWLLSDQFYTDNRGIDFSPGNKNDSEESTWGVMI